MRSNPIRFTGMASGMDTDSIVKDLMRPQQYKIDTQKKNQALIKLKQDAWKDMNTKLYDFHTKVTHKMSLESTFNTTTTTSSNPDVVSIDEGVKVPEGTHTFEVTQLAQSASAVGRVDGGKIPLANTKLSELMPDGVPIQLSMKIGEEWVDVKGISGEDTLSGLATKINTALKEKNTGFTAKYDQVNGSFFIASTATGADQKISFGQQPEEGKALFDKLGLTNSPDNNGKDAIYKYNGSEFVSASNKIEVNGIKATLKSDQMGKTIIASEPDTEAIYTWVKDFVTEYNTLIDDINDKIGAKPGKDIMPLTSEERESMSDTDIKLWEEKLNNSLFYRDDQLTSFVDTARKTLGKVFEGKSLASLGIVTGSWQEKGKLYILGDEDAGVYATETNKLKAAIEEGAEEVTTLLKTVGKELYDAHNATFQTSNKLKSAMKFYNDKLMTENVTAFDKRIATLEERMYKMEDIQYAKFATMEKMLSSLNNQSSWLSQQFGG